jgi:DNA-binding LytR/AlgR family response regulator
MGAYLRIVTTHAKIMTLQTFSQLEKLLSSEHFHRIHKSFIVSLDKIESIERNVAKIGEQRIPIGKNYQEEFYKKLG